MTEWLRDKNDNKCSVELFGSKEKAQEALDSLVNCSNCSNCSYCSNCHGCSNCSYCSNLSNCSYCIYCSNCHGCSDCSDCSNCSGCSNCSNCHGCINCHGCSNCIYCSNCHGCSDCSDCSYCFDGSGVKKEINIPKIDNIHQEVYEAASVEGALEMDRWHTCNTAHCRAGWVIKLAGEKGRELENDLGTPLAAKLIYRESSDIKVHWSDFYTDNETALQSMKEAAILEKGEENEKTKN